VVAGLDRTAQIRWAGPSVGQHNDEVYGGLLGLSKADIATFKEQGVI